VAPKDKKILLVGDLIIDKTIMVAVTKVSPEAPVPVAEILPRSRSRESPGGAGSAAAFANKDNIPLIFLTACPPDRLAWLHTLGIEAEAHDNRCENVTKIRYIDVNTGYHLLRVDTDRTISYPDLHTLNGTVNFQEQLNSVLEDHDIACIALLDYRKGMLTKKPITQWIIETGKKNGIPTYVDSRSEDLTRFKGANVLKLNQKEYNFAHGALNADCVLDVKSRLNVDTLIITKGAEGAELYTCPPEEKWSEHFAYPDLTKYDGSPDVIGCGDAFDMTFCYTWSILGKSLDEALQVAVDRASQFAHEPIGVRIGC
jgi:bifunctional ADP-heptose synthase (sugar kinase/adenylyltransferase)